MATADTELRRTFYLLGSLTLVGFLLYWAQPVMIPMTIAVLATFILAPIVSWMERRGVSRVIASTIVVVGAALLMLAIAQIFVLQAASLASELPAYKTQVAHKVRDFREATANSWLVGAMDFANEVAKTPDAKDTIQDQKAEPIVTKMEVPIIPVIQSVTGMFLTFLFDAILIFILAFFMLIRREDLRNRIIHVLGANNLVTATRALDDASKRISRFLFSQLILNCGFGAAVTIGLYLIGIPYAYIWGAMAAILRYIPFLGGWISAAFPLLASLVMPDWTPFLLTAVFFIVIELLTANLVEPLVFGHSIGVSGVGQLVAALFWACLWGPVGLILSAPMTACVCVVGRHFPGLHFISTLMGDDEVVEKPTAFYQRLLAGDSSEASDLVEAYLKEHPAPDVVDEILIPALLSGQTDRKNGELTKEDQLSITDSVREIYFDLIGPLQKNHLLPRSSDLGDAHVLVVEFPFNDEVDDLIVEILKNEVGIDRSQWWSESVKNTQLDGISRQEDGGPSVIYLATSAKQNLARIRGACRAVRKLFPDAKILVCCWRLEMETDLIRTRLKEAGATAVCTTLLEAIQFMQANGPIDRVESRIAQEVPLAISS